MDVRVVVPGEPVSQGRPRFSRRGRHVITRDPAKSANWKAHARFFMAAAYPHRRELMTGPLTVEITAIFSCPESDRRKRVPAPRRPHAKLGDADNIGKAVLDAATGVLWEDDAQVARLLIEKFIGAQDEEPRVELLVREWTP